MANDANAVTVIVRGSLSGSPRASPQPVEPVFSLLTAREELSLAAPDNEARPIVSARYLLVSCALMVAVSCVYGLLFIFLPLGHHPKAGWWTNWMYAWLQPTLVEALYNCEIVLGGSGGYLRILYGAPWPYREHAISIAMAVVLMLLTHTLPTRFLGFYPFNWIASHLAMNMVGLPVMEKRLVRFCPEEHREAYAQVLKLGLSMANASLVAVALSVGFLVLFYRVPSNVQFLSVLGYHLLMYLSKFAMRRTVLKNDYPLPIFAVWAVAVAQDHELFVAFAYPSAHTTGTLALIIATQVITGLWRPLTYTERYLGTFGRFGRVGSAAGRLQVKVINDVAILLTQLASPLVFIVIALGFRYGPNRRFYPFAKLSDDQFNAALVIAALSAALAVVELVATAAILERVFHISVYHHAILACDKGPVWRTGVLVWLFTSLVFVVLVLQMHANVIYLLQPHLYGDAVD